MVDDLGLFRANEVIILATSRLQDITGSFLEGISTKGSLFDSKIHSEISEHVGNGGLTWKRQTWLAGVRPPLGNR
jgi:hypothetical protein